jgi:hypothetical protein
MSANVVWKRLLSYFPELVKGNSGAAPSVDFTQGSIQSLTLNAATVTPTFVNPPGGCSLALVATQDGVGGRAVTWPGSVTWIGGTPPVLLAGAGQTTLVNFYFDGTTYFGWLATAGSPSSLLPWTDVAAGTTLAASLSKPNLAFDTSAAQSNVTLPTAANMVNADGFQFLVKCTGNMLSPVIVNAGAGTTVELLNAPGTFGASTWLPIQGQSAFFKYDLATTTWKAWAAFTGSGVPGTPAYNPGWYAGTTLFVDEQNASGTAKDSNSGRTAGTAVLTWTEAVRRWGASNPQLSVATLAITHLSSCATEVRFTPSIEGGFPSMTAVDGAITPAVLAGVTARNRTAGANSPLIATLPAGTLVGDQVRNTTVGKISRCFVAKALGGNSFVLTQPLVPVAGEVVFPLPAEVSTWANGDTANVVRMVRVNVVQARSIVIDFDVNFANVLTLSNFTISDPSGFGNDNAELGPGLNLNEINVERFHVATGTVGLTDLYLNVLWQGGGDTSASEAQYIGGGIVGILHTFTACSLVFDGDFVAEALLSFTFGHTTIGLLFMGGGGLFFLGGEMSNRNASYGAHVLYGTAAIVVQLTGNTRAAMESGTWAAGWTAPTLVTGVTMNGGTVAQTHTNASPDVVTSNVTTSVANADAANGGNMMVWGGASLSKAA